MAARFAPGDAAAAPAEVAHQVARILVGRVHLDLHHRLKKRRPGLLHGLLKGQRARYFEGDI